MNDTKLNDTSLKALLRKMIDEAPKTGAIPNNMIYWTAGSHAMPWANVVSESYITEVKFDDAN